MFPSLTPPALSQNHSVWSVMIPTYNSSSFLESTLLSIIKQDPGEEIMQIEIVDDCSARDPAIEVLNKLKLMDRVQYYRQPENVGLSRNWNECIQRAKGEFVHILHQDDLVLPEFYINLEQAFRHQPEIGAAFCRNSYIDKNGMVSAIPPSALLQISAGIIPNFLEQIAIRQLIQTPSIAVRRCVYERVGGFHPDLAFTLDWEMWIRIAAKYPIWYEPKILSVYRFHSQSETARLNSTGRNIRDMRRFYDIRRSYLPIDIIKKCETKSKRENAFYAFTLASNQLVNHNFRSALLLIYEGLRLRTDLQTIILLCKEMFLHIILKLKPQAHYKII